MKKYVNGLYIEMTEEEIAEFKEQSKKMAEEAKKTPPTAEERLEAVETALLELAGVLFND